MLNHEVPPRLFDLKNTAHHPLARTLFSIFEQPVERLLSLGELNRLYARSLSIGAESNYFAAVLATLNIEYKIPAGDQEKIPATGPLVVVANHPFGAVDGVILGDIMTGVRRDVRLMGNQLLAGVPEIKPWIIPVDPFGGPDSVKENIAGLKSALRWLQDGHSLGVFPAGTVSYLNMREGGVVDPDWHIHVASLVRRTGATVVPVFFEGRNSALFQIAGMLHQGLRTALLPRELLRRSDSTVSVRIGRPIGPEKVARYEEDGTLLDYLRFKTYMLTQRESPVRPRFRPNRKTKTPIDSRLPVVDAVPTAMLVPEIEALGPEAVLAQQGDLQVYMAHARQIPFVLREIGRLREITFRDVGEGSGRTLDLDRFDDHYQHLFMWNRATSEVVGSYRMGRVADILGERGREGLYTSTLFKFDSGLLESLGPSLELGRSFVRAEYQRKPASLALMWKGIGEYLVRNPSIKVLFGPVSISREYAPLSKRLMVDLLTEQRGDRKLGAMVKARNPPKTRAHKREVRAARDLVKDVDDLAALVAEIEGGDRGMPILLRHYLKLNARLLGFNVDPAFGHCLDGLIVVDLRTTEEKLLKRFMGEEGLARFKAAA